MRPAFASTLLRAAFNCSPSSVRWARAAASGSMLAAGPATKQIWQLSQETGVAFEPAAYIPGVRGYYSLTDGRLASMPFNSSIDLCASA